MGTQATAASALIGRWLEENPHKPGPAEWRIKGTGLPVWRVLGQVAVELGAEDWETYREINADSVDPELVKTVAAYYDVDPDAVYGALAYANRHPEPVIARLVLDRAAFSD